MPCLLLQEPNPTKAAAQTPADLNDTALLVGLGLIEIGNFPYICHSGQLLLYLYQSVDKSITIVLSKNIVGFLCLVSLFQELNLTKATAQTPADLNIISSLVS